MRPEDPDAAARIGNHVGAETRRDADPAPERVEAAGGPEDRCQARGIRLSPRRHHCFLVVPLPFRQRVDELTPRLWKTLFAGELLRSPLHSLLTSS